MKTNPDPTAKWPSGLSVALLLILACGLLGACAGPKGRTSRYCFYQDQHVFFTYPPEWKVRKSAVDLIFVESKPYDSALLTIDRVKGEKSPDLAGFAADYSRRAAEGSPALGRPLPGSSQFSPGRDPAGGGPVIRESLLVQGMGRNLSYYREYRFRQTPDAVYYFVAFAAEKDRSVSDPRFGMVLESMVYLVRGKGPVESR